MAILELGIGWILLAGAGISSPGIILPHFLKRMDKDTLDAPPPAAENGQMQACCAVDTAKCI